MQKHHTSGAGSDAIASAHQSRRNFLVATAGVAASLPAVAIAGPERQLGGLVQLSDRQQLDVAIEGLKAILVRMHPVYDRIEGRYLPIQNGGGLVLVDIETNRNNAPAPKGGPEKPDPLIAEIKAYRAGLAEFDRICDISDGLDGERMEATFMPHQRALENWAMPAQSAKAAVEALTLALDEMRSDVVVGPVSSMIKAAVGYLAGRS